MEFVVDLFWNTILCFLLLLLFGGFVVLHLAGLHVRVLVDNLFWIAGASLILAWFISSLQAIRRREKRGR